LALAARKVHTVFTEHRVERSGNRADEILHRDERERLPDVLVGQLFARRRQRLPQRTGEQMRVLRHQRDLLPKRSDGAGWQRAPVEEDLADVGSNNRTRRLSSVLLPAPLAPTST